MIAGPNAASCRALALALGLVATGCSSSTGSAGTGSGGTATGGQCKSGSEAPYANPAGAAFTLPAGVTFEGEIVGNLSGDIKEHCRNATKLENASDLVLACFGVRNAAATDVVVTFPAGLVFVAKNTATDNGILVHEHTVTLPAGLSYFSVRPASLNQACMPGGESDTYTIGNVTNDPKLVEVLTLAKNKKIDGDIGAEIVGRMIWDVTDGNGVTDEHRMQLAAAPDQ